MGISIEMLENTELFESYYKDHTHQEICELVSMCEDNFVDYEINLTEIAQEINAMKTTWTATESNGNFLS